MIGRWEVLITILECTWRGLLWGLNQGSCHEGQQPLCLLSSTLSHPRNHETAGGPVPCSAPCVEYGDARDTAGWRGYRCLCSR